MAGPGVAARGRAWVARRRATRLHILLSRTAHRTVLSVLDHDCLNIAQSTAYSAIVALFPALIVAAAVVGLLPDTAPVRYELAAFFNRVMPPGVSALLDAYFQNAPKNEHSIRALAVAGVVSFLGASNVVATLMEALRRAAHLPEHCWTFVQRRVRSFELVPLSLIPLAVASLLVIFGHTVTMWIAPGVSPGILKLVYAVALLVRWALSLGTSVGLTALIYRMGTPLRVSWLEALPGAIVATAMWFLTTLAFGWYVTRFANYSEVYGSLAVGIALLFWLYIVSLSVVCGAEFNAQFQAQLRAGGVAGSGGQATAEADSLRE